MTTLANPSRITHSPWGHPQTQTVRADGIIAVSTASHGGIFLSPERWETFQQLFPTFRPWAGEQWLEEDCDAALAIVAFPEVFDDQAVYHAVKMVEGYGDKDGGGNYFADAKRYLASAESAAVRARSDAFYDTIKDQWQTGGMSTSGKQWSVWLSRVRDNARCIVKMDDYPSKSFFTDAEVAQFEVEKEVA